MSSPRAEPTPTGERLRGERLASQLLAGPGAAGPIAVAERLLAVQAQDPRGARLAVRARARGTTAADVDRALSEDRALVVGWLNRGTLHLVRREDYFWLLDLTGPPRLSGNARRLAQEGVSPDAAERGVAVMRRSLEQEGPLTRAALRERIAAAGVRTEGQALVHILMLACLRGLAVRGPMAGADQAFVATRDWLGEPPAVERHVALAELARRYLAGHAPADDRDLANWAGIALGDARAGLRAIASEVRQRDDGLLEPVARASAPDVAPPRLLGAFEPLLLGWKSREPFVGKHRELVTTNGVFRPFALVGGRAVAKWTLKAGAVVLDPFAEISAQEAAALEADAGDVRRFLGL